MAVAFKEVQLPALLDRRQHVKVVAVNGSHLPFKRDEKTFVTSGGGSFYCGEEDSFRNRMICWRTRGNILELTETCLDYSLHGNHLTLEFEGEVLLPQVVINETPQQIVILAASTTCVYRLLFDHPIKENQGYLLQSGVDVSHASIFYRARGTELTAKQNMVSLPQTAHSFSAVSMKDGSCYFSVITEGHNIFLVTLPPRASYDAESVEITELKCTGIMGRLWSGLVPSLLRTEDSSDVALYTAFFKSTTALYLLVLCKDLKLRIFSCKTLECVNVVNVKDFIPENVDSHQGIAQAYLLKRNVDVRARDQFVTVFLNFAYQSEFIVFAIHEQVESITLQYEQRFFSEKSSLQDFTMTSKHLWVLWGLHDGTSEAQVVSLAGASVSSSDWHPLYLSQPETDDVFVSSDREPKEVYLEALFFPGRFSKASILKAMQITIKSSGLELDVAPSADLKLSELREQVIHMMDVEAFGPLVLLQVKVLRNAVDFEAEAMEYAQLQLQCWSRLYGSVLQYDQVERKALGIFASSQDGQVTIVRQKYIGFVYPLDWIECLYLNESNAFLGEEEQALEKIQGHDKRLAKDLLSLMDCVRAVRSQFPVRVFHNVDVLLEQGDDILSYMDTLMESMLTNKGQDELLIGDAKFKSDFLRETELRLQRIILHSKCVRAILTAIDGMLVVPEAQEVQFGVPLLPFNFCGGFVGASFLSKIIQDKAEIRKNICRDLIPILKLLVRLSGRVGLDLRSSNIVNSEDIPELCQKIYGFFSIFWLARKAAGDIPLSMEDNVKHLAALELAESPGMLQRNLQRGAHRPGTLLEGFLATSGIPAAQRFLQQVEQNPSKNEGTWSKRLTTLLNVLMVIIWPNSPGTALPEYLLCQNQYTALGDHLMRLQLWCKANRGSIRFLRGQAYLGNRQFRKALECFVKAAEYVDNKEDLFCKFLPASSDNKRELIVQYFMRVLRLFEQFNSSEMAIVAASSAFAVAPKGDSSIPVLLSNIFKHHLELGHNEEAYAAITQNPDKSRRRDCLHHFIVTLCERKQLKEICEFPFIGMEEEVISVIETRARTVDITVNKYYNLLYAFHIYKDDYCRAARAMYEHASRLRNEMHGLASLQVQAKCLLAAINCLKIVDPKYAWIVKVDDRSIAFDFQEPSMLPQRSPKRTGDGEEVDQIAAQQKARRKTTMIEVADLERDYALLLAKLKLLQREEDKVSIIGPSLSASEAVSLLSQAGMFDAAFSTAKAFKLPLAPVFEGLAVKCAQITQHSVQGDLSEEIWDCLIENDLKSGKSTASASEQLWELMKSYLIKYTKSPQELYYKPVASKLFSHGCPPPVWFLNMYKRDNPSELLRLYICFDLLEEAVDLTSEYIDAVLGIGKEYFGLKSALHANMPSVWMPYNAIDQLLQVLKENLEDPKVGKLYKSLRSKLDHYHHKVETVSRDMLELGLCKG